MIKLQCYNVKEWTMYSESMRVVLREYNTKDINNLNILFNEKSVREYGEYLPNDMESIEDHIMLISKDSDSDIRKHFKYIIELKDGQFIGVVGYSYVEEYIYELEYFLLEKYWNQGYATEAVKQIFDLAKENNGKVKTIFAICQTDNKSSERVMIKSGMKKSIEQPKPKEYNGVYKERIKYELDFKA